MKSGLFSPSVRKLKEICDETQEALTINNDLLNTFIVKNYSERSSIKRLWDENLNLETELMEKTQKLFGIWGTSLISQQIANESEMAARQLIDTYEEKIEDLNYYLKKKEKAITSGKETHGFLLEDIEIVSKSRNSILVAPSKSLMEALESMRALQRTLQRKMNHLYHLFAWKKRISDSCRKLTEKFREIRINLKNDEDTDDLACIERNLDQLRFDLIDSDEDQNQTVDTPQTPESDKLGQIIQSYKTKISSIQKEYEINGEEYIKLLEENNQLNKENQVLATEYLNRQEFYSPQTQRDHHSYYQFNSNSTSFEKTVRFSGNTIEI